MPQISVILKPSNKTQDELGLIVEGILVEAQKSTLIPDFKYKALFPNRADDELKGIFIVDCEKTQDVLPYFSAHPDVQAAQCTPARRVLSPQGPDAAL